MKKIIYLAAAFLCMACSDDHESDQQHGGASGSVTEVTPVTSDLSVDLSTDKAFYTGQIIEDARKKAKITQAELARRIGSDRSYISRVESGQTEPKVSTFYRIMNALGCKIEFSMIL